MPVYLWGKHFVQPETFTEMAKNVLLISFMPFHFPLELEVIG